MPRRPFLAAAVAEVEHAAWRALESACQILNLVENFFPVTRPVTMLGGGAYMMERFGTYRAAEGFRGSARHTARPKVRECQPAFNWCGTAGIGW